MRQRTFQYTKSAQTHCHWIRDMACYWTYTMQSGLLALVVVIVNLCSATWRDKEPW